MKRQSIQVKIGERLKVETDGFSIEGIIKTVNLEAWQGEVVMVLKFAVPQRKEVDEAKVTGTRGAI